MINPQKNTFYIHSRQEGGHGCIDFCRKVMEMDFKTAVREITGEGERTKTFVPKETNEEKKIFSLPQSAENAKRVFAYLINQRGISADIISELMKQRLLFQDKNGNAIFVHRDKDGKAIGADVQGTLSEKRYKGVVPGSGGTFTYQKGTTYDKVFLFEAPIDLISYVQMHPEVNNACFVSMGGLKPQLISEYLNNDKLRIISCVDNDVAGQNFNNKILYEKMSKKIELCSPEEKKITVDDRVIRYSEATIQDKPYTFFVSADDIKFVKNFNGEPLKWKNTSNFEVNNECKEANVKDFNELLKKTQQQDLISKTTSADKWASQIRNKIIEVNMTKENVR